MVTQDIKLINKLGLHARSAAKLVSVASAYSADCMLQYKEKKVSAKSIMELLMLAAKFEETLTINCEGEDEEEALKAIIELIDRRFDESE